MPGLLLVLFLVGFTGKFPPEADQPRAENKMRTASLKLKNYAGSINIVDNSNLKRRILYILLISFGALGFFYVLILGNMTFNIIERRALEGSARTLSNEVLNLELTYLQISSKVDLILAKSLGFQETKINFATRKSLGSIKFAKNDL